MSVFAFLVVGLLLLIAGAESLVRGASRLAAAAGVSPLVVGLTVVAFGTSAPELAVSVKSALEGQANIALGNVVGSNVFNVLFILGLSALVAPLVVDRQLVRLDVPLMVALSIAVLLLALDGALGRVDGALLVAGLAAYLLFLWRQGRREEARRASPREQGAPAARADAERAARGGAARRLALDALLVLVGLAMLVLGSRWLVAAAVGIAGRLGVSELVIGLTIVAAGTSLPEVVTSLVAALRGERDIAVGNVVGSNIFNLMAVLGVASLVAPGGIEIAPALLRFDLPVMIAVALACLPIFFTGHRISRGEGGLLLAYYAAYTLYLVLAANQHAALPRLSAAMLFFVVPLTAITLTLIAAREWRARRRG